MQDVPKIVVKRLQERAAAGTHPDADLLAAFAERSLGEAERVRVVEHLSRCGDCRDVVALAALPATEVAEVNVLVAPTSGSWFRWPVLRWVVAAAGIVAIASAGLVQYRQRQRNDTLVSRLTSSETSTTAEAIPSPSAPSAGPEIKEAPSLTEKQRRAENLTKGLASGTDNWFADKLVSPVNPAAPKARAMDGAAAGSASRGTVGFANDGANIVAKAAPSSSSSDTIAVNGKLQIATPAEAAKLAPSLNIEQPGAGAAGTASQTVEVESQGEAVTETTDRPGADQLIENKREEPLSYPASPTVGVVAPRDAASEIKVARSSLASPRWSIGAEGALLRSFDAGNTWVEVNVNSEMPSNRAKAGIAGDTLQNALKKNSKSQGGVSPVFRAVSAQGAEVWAGGSAAMLYHSSDSGVHWTRALPSSSGAPLTGDITTIEFSDAQHGRIVTSGGEVWITADNGRTWRR